MDWAPGPGSRILAVERDGDRWVISAVGPEIGSCPGCREPSTRRHSRYFRHLQDLPAQGAAVMVKMQASRWRCLNGECERRTFTDQLPEIVCPHARRTQRIAELVHLIGHGTGGRPGERLMKRLGMPVSDDTILRHLKRQVARLRAKDDRTGGRRRRLELAQGSHLRDHYCRPGTARGCRCAAGSHNRRNSRMARSAP